MAKKAKTVKKRKAPAKRKAAEPAPAAAKRPRARTVASESRRAAPLPDAATGGNSSDDGLIQTQRHGPGDNAENPESEEEESGSESGSDCQAGSDDESEEEASEEEVASSDEDKTPQSRRDMGQSRAPPPPPPPAAAPRSKKAVARMDTGAAPPPIPPRGALKSAPQIPVCFKNISRTFFHPISFFSLLVLRAVGGSLRRLRSPAPLRRRWTRLAMPSRSSRRCRRPRAIASPPWRGGPRRPLTRRRPPRRWPPRRRNMSARASKQIGAHGGQTQRKGETVKIHLFF